MPQEQSTPLIQLRIAWAKARALFSKKRLDREFDEEIANHVELSVQDGLNRGLTPGQARREAIQRLGGVEPVKELHRDARGFPPLETIVQDLSYAARTLRKTPAFTFVVIASLALGIGANTAVFTLINAALLRTLPVPRPEGLVLLRGDPIIPFPMYRDLRERQEVFTDILATTREWQVRLTIPGQAGAETIDNFPTTFVTANYFAVLEIQPRIGRFFTEEDDRIPESAESQGSVAVISDAFWERQFGRDPDVLNRMIHVNRAACRIIGVAPPGYAGESVGQPTDLWAPLVAFSPRRYLENRDGQFTRSIARLRDGVSMEQAQGAITALYRQLLEAQTGRRDRRPVQSRALRLSPAATGLDSGLRRTFAEPLRIVMAIVAVVLLVACANVANLLLARSTWRRREFSVRLALGCGRSRLIRQLLTESLLLAALGACAGVLLAYWGSRALLLMTDAGPLSLQPDARVLAFVIAISFLTGIGFGVAPAIRASRVDAGPALNEQGRGGAGRQLRRRLSRTLVMAQVALSMMLAIAAGLLIRSMHNLRQVNLGFRPEQVLAFELAHNARDPRPVALAGVARLAGERLRQVPGVRSSSLSLILLFSDSDLRQRLKIRDNPATFEDPVAARFNCVSPGYFETVGMAVLEGRGIEEQDSDTAPPVAVINETMARRYFPPGSPLGRFMEIAGQGWGGKPIRIAGVVRDAKYNDIRAEIQPMFYLSMQQFPTPVRALEVRTAEPAAAIAGAIRVALREVAPDLMIRRVISLSGQVDETLLPERMITNLAAAFGIIALMLAGIGLYGVMSYAVAQRTSEIGIRMALGASRSDVLRMVLTQSVVMVTGGVAAGIALAAPSARLIRAFLFGLSPLDAATIASAILVLFAAAAIAAYLPARRATRVDPMVALRYE